MYLRWCTIWKITNVWITLWEASFSVFRQENRRDCGKGSCSKPHVIFLFCHIQAGLKQPMSASPMMGGCWGDAQGHGAPASIPKAGGCAACLGLSETLGACLILSHYPSSESSQLTFFPACSSAEDSSLGQKQGRRVARGGPWLTVAIMVSGFITVLNGMTVGHNKSASLLSKSQTIKGLAVKVIHHHKDLRRSSLQFHSHSQYTREECWGFRGEKRDGEKKGENN